MKTGMSFLITYVLSPEADMCPFYLNTNILKARFSQMETFRKVVMALCEHARTKLLPGHGTDPRVQKAWGELIHRSPLGVYTILVHLESVFQLPISFMTVLQGHGELLNYEGSQRTFFLLNKNEHGTFALKFPEIFLYTQRVALMNSISSRL